MTDMKDALTTYAQAEAAIWAHVGVSEPPGYAIVDLTEYPWRKGYSEVWWWEDMDAFKAAMREAEDLYDMEPEYSGEVWGTSVWEGETHTIAVLDLGSGRLDAFVFLNENRISP